MQEVAEVLAQFFQDLWRPPVRTSGAVVALPLAHMEDGSLADLPRRSQ